MVWTEAQEKVLKERGREDIWWQMVTEEHVFFHKPPRPSVFKLQKEVLETNALQRWY